MKNFDTVILLFILVTIAAFVFRNLFSNISTGLADWNDYPFVVWAMSQTAVHVRHMQLSGLFDANIFSPNKGTLLFSETFILEGIVMAVLSVFSSNQILNFNVIFLLTILLNIISTYVFWHAVFRSKTIAFFGSLTTAFSPYVFIMIGHFQMYTLWPLFFGLTLLVKRRGNWLGALGAGIFAGVLFYGSVYLSLMMCLIVGVWFLTSSTTKSWKSYLKALCISGILFAVSFGAIALPLIVRYQHVVDAYHIQREFSEYVMYSAHITDYLFFSNNPGLLTQTPIIRLWDGFNNHLVGESATFPTFTILSLAVIGIFLVKRRRHVFEIDIPRDAQAIFFLLLIVIGFTFSLGPRLNANGAYLRIPLPYAPLLKVFPLLWPIRATARWSLLFYTGLTYFALVGIRRLREKKKTATYIILIGASLLYMFEILPLNMQFPTQTYASSLDQKLKQVCDTNHSVLLEYPMTESVETANIITNLTYRSQLQLASTIHGCSLVNGYSGYFPQDYTRFEGQLDLAFQREDSKAVTALLQEKHVSWLKVNLAHAGMKQQVTVTKTLSLLRQSNIVTLTGSDDDQSLYAVTTSAAK